jgi:bifunctional DNA-binding transcriptional regulator/antitoxin component of YhaV-PrlF toxin-antitoxin module
MKVIKINSKNQITLPQTILKMVGHVVYFQVAEEGGKIVLTPLPHLEGINDIRTKLDQLGINEDDVNESVRWARQRLK